MQITELRFYYTVYEIIRHNSISYKIHNDSILSPFLLKEGDSLAQIRKK